MQRFKHPLVGLSLYVAGLLVIEFLSRADGLTSADVSLFTWWDWLKFILGIFGAVFLLVKAYLSTAFADHLAASDAASDPPPPPK